MSKFMKMYGREQRDFIPPIWDELKPTANSEHDASRPIPIEQTQARRSHDDGNSPTPTYSPNSDNKDVDVDTENGVNACIRAARTRDHVRDDHSLQWLGPITPDEIDTENRTDGEPTPFTDELPLFCTTRLFLKFATTRVSHHRPESHCLANMQRSTYLNTRSHRSHSK